jgi:sec-independent protein translocase protein TatB
MFNIHTTELLLICVIALIVIGPERLPGAIKTAGLWIGRFRRSFYKVKAEIERELNADEIRRQLHNESVLAELDEAKAQIQSTAKEADESVNRIVNSADFDPGASSATDTQAGASHATDTQAGASRATNTQAGDHKSVREELEEVGEQLDEVRGQLYGTGKNPKLAQGENPKQDKADNGIG